MNSKKTFARTVIVFILLVFFAGKAFAASCPYCGQSYGEPMPGDEARVYGLRRQHEANCSARTGGSSTSGYGERAASSFMKSFMKGFKDGSKRRQTYQGPTPQELELQRKRAASTEQNNLGVACAEGGDYDNAIRHYEEAIKLNPENEAARDNRRIAKAKKANHIGIQYFNDENWEMSVRYFKEAVGFSDHEIYRENLRYAKALLDKQMSQEMRTDKIEDAKEKINAMLDELASDLGTPPPAVDAGGSMHNARNSDAEGMEFMAPDPAEPTFSKGTEYSAPVVLDSVDSQEPALLRLEAAGQNQVQKGLTFMEVPEPGIAQESRKTIREMSKGEMKTTEIVLEAMEYGAGDWEKSIMYLEKYLEERGRDNSKVIDALSYLEGMRSSESAAGKQGNAKLFDPDGYDHQRLLGDDLWQSPKEENVIIAPDWKQKRTQKVLEAFEVNSDDWVKSVEYCRHKATAATDIQDFVSYSTAASYIKGLSVHHLATEGTDLKK